MSLVHELVEFYFRPKTRISLLPPGRPKMVLELTYLEMGLDYLEWDMGVDVNGDVRVIEGDGTDNCYLPEVSGEACVRPCVPLKFHVNPPDNRGNPEGYYPVFKAWVPRGTQVIFSDR